MELIGESFLFPLCHYNAVYKFRAQKWNDWSLIFGQQWEVSASPQQLTIEICKKESICVNEKIFCPSSLNVSCDAVTALVKIYAKLHVRAISCRDQSCYLNLMKNSTEIVSSLTTDQITSQPLQKLKELSVRFMKDVVPQLDVKYFICAVSDTVLTILTKLRMMNHIDCVPDHFSIRHVYELSQWSYRPFLIAYGILRDNRQLFNISQNSSFPMLMPIPVGAVVLYGNCLAQDLWLCIFLNKDTGCMEYRVGKGWGEGGYDIKVSLDIVPKEFFREGDGEQELFALLAATLLVVSNSMFHALLDNIIAQRLTTLACRVTNNALKASTNAVVDIIGRLRSSAQSRDEFEFCFHELDVSEAFDRFTGYCRKLIVNALSPSDDGFLTHLLLLCEEKSVSNQLFPSSQSFSNYSWMTKANYQHNSQERVPGIVKTFYEGSTNAMSPLGPQSAIKDLRTDINTQLFEFYDADSTSSDMVGANRFDILILNMGRILHTCEKFLTSFIYEKVDLFSRILQGPEVSGKAYHQYLSVFLRPILQDNVTWIVQRLVDELSADGKLRFSDSLLKAIVTMICKMRLCTPRLFMSGNCGSTYKLNKRQCTMLDGSASEGSPCRLLLPPIYSCCLVTGPRLVPQEECVFVKGIVLPPGNLA